MRLALVEHGDDLLYRYISREQFRKRRGFYHPDPMIEEFSYGEGGAFAPFLWNHLAVGSRLFFHTTIGGMRYVTAMYYVADFAPAAVWRVDKRMKRKYRNPHLHAEDCPEWWGDGPPSKDDPFEQEVRDLYNEGVILVDADLVVIGDPDRSFDIRKTPVVLDKVVAARLDLLGKPIKWDIVDRTGKRFCESRCITVCLRVPRVLSETDGDYLGKLVREAAGVAKADQSYSVVTALDPFIASELQLACATEEEIEACLINNLEALGKGLRLVANQVRLTDGSRIDILARTRAGVPVIVEIKKGTADDSTLTQLLAYMHQFMRQHPDGTPIGKIVCADASYRLRTACDHLGIQIHCYGDILLRNAR